MFKNNRKLVLIVAALFFGLVTQVFAEEVMTFDDLKADAFAFEKEEVWEKAEETYRTMTQVYPDKDESWFRLGKFLIDRNRPKEAVPFYEKGLEINPESETALLYMAWIYLEIGQPHKSLEFTARVRNIQGQTSPEVTPA